MCSNLSCKVSMRSSFMTFTCAETADFINRRRRASYACWRLRSAASCAAARSRASFSRCCCCLTHSRRCLRLLFRCNDDFETAGGRGVCVLFLLRLSPAGGCLSGRIFSHAVVRLSLRSTRAMNLLAIASTCRVFTISIIGSGTPSRKNNTAVIYAQEVWDVCVCME